MQMMGLKDFPYWMSWFITYFIEVTVISIICIVIISFKVLVHSDLILIFIFFWIYGISLFGFAILVSSFFSKSRPAAITGTFLYFATSFLDFAVQNKKLSSQAKYSAAFFPTVALSRGSYVLSNYEISGRGLKFDNIWEPFENYQFGASLALMIISFFVFLFVGLYFDKIIPSSGN